MAIQTQKDTGSSYAVTPSMDGAVWQVATQDCVAGGVGDEFTMTYSSSSLNVSFAAGSEAVIGGAFFRVTSLEAVTLVANSTIYLCANIDVSKANGSRGSFAQRTSSNMQSGNINGSGTSRDLLLYIVTTGASGVTSVVDKRRIVDVGGRNYLSGNFINIDNNGYINGKIGIDANNLIHSVNGYIPESTPWTATQDCWCLVRFCGKTIHIGVDGLRVVSGQASAATLGSLDAGNMAFPIKKGQSVAVYQTGNHSDTSASVKFYGVK